jgi:hypothetical protein
MSLRFIECKTISNNQYIQRMLHIVDKNLQVFLYFSRIFATHKSNNEENLELIDRFIDNIFNSVKFRSLVDSDTCKETKSLFKSIYRDKHFSKIRSKFLEAVVYYYGPFRCSTRVNVYIEPKIFDDDIIVGETDNRCDVVFHIRDSDPIEFVECKADILNYIPKTLPISELNEERRKQINYLVNVHNYLKDNYTEPVMLFVSYNLEYEDSLKNARENWGCTFFDCFSPLDIIRSKNSLTN